MSVLAVLAVYIVLWSMLYQSLPRATTDPGAALPGAAIIGLTMSVLQSVTQFYLPNQIELAFLQIQGSGLIRLGDGTLMRVNYADQNGHPYRAIGRVLLDRIPREEMSLQKIRDYLYRHPEEERDILAYNPSYTFFRTVDEGPLGSIEVPLTAGRSLAMDHRLLPRGGLVFIEASYPAESLKEGEAARFSRLGVVQDTGGAIRGHGRADIFWGSGEEAERIAGPMKEKGRIFLLVARKEYL